MDKETKKTLQKVANLMADATGDDSWCTVDLEKLHGWIDITLGVSQCVTDLQDQSVEPSNLGQR